MNRFGKLISRAAAVLGLASATAYGADRPNVLFILTDDLGIMDVGAYGGMFYETPRIDALANQGLRFTDAYVAHPRCVPSRAALMTGRFPASIGCPGGGAWRGGLDTKYVTIGETMRDAGYTTGFIGKWHLGGEGRLPTDQGFGWSLAAGEAGSPRSYFAPYDGPFPEDQAWRAKKEPIGLEANSPDEYLTDRLTDEAIGFIERSANADSPFFLVLSHYAVHQPIDAKPDVASRYKDKLASMEPYEGPEFLPRDGVTKAHQDDPEYAAVVESVDDSVGRLLDTLDRLGIAGDTLVVFTSDHGGLSNRGAKSKRQVETSNLPYRAGKGHLYDGGVRVPLIVRWPGVTPDGATTDALTVNVDFLPTLTEFAGGSAPADIDGVSIAAAFRGEPFERSGPIFWHSPEARPGPTGDTNSSAVLLGGWKLLHFWDEDRTELYQLGADPYETTNLAETESEKTSELLGLLDAWRTSIGAAGDWKHD